MPSTTLNYTVARRRAPRPTDRSLPVAFASVQDPGDIRQWSGSVYFMAKALERNGAMLEYMTGLQRRRLMFSKALTRLYHLNDPGSSLSVDRTLSMARHMAAELGDRLARSHASAVFSPGSIPLALLRTERPKVFYTDATFAGLLGIYPELHNYPKHHIAEGHDLEREAIRTSSRLIYSSQWAADSAVRDYGADPDKVRVVPFGSNLELRPSERYISRCIEERPHERCELVFVGVNWERKGGPLALEVARTLNEMGISTRLTVVGCQPDAEDLPTYVEVVPFVAKDTAWGQRQLAKLIARAHFLLMPSIAECFGIVYAEASSLGVPSLARNVGGVPSAVRDGVNGHLLPLAAPAVDYARMILAYMVDRPAYEELARSSYAHYRRHLNWSVAGNALMEALHEVC